MNARMNARTNVIAAGRRLTVLAAVAALALVAAACGNGDEDAEETTTTAPTETTLPTLTDEEFDEQVDEMLLDPVEAAGTDLCAVFDAAEGGPAAMPSSENQVRKIVDSYVAVLQSLAATEPVDEEQAAVLLETAENIRAAAEEQDYDLELLSDPEFGELQSSPEFLGAAETYTNRYQQECTPGGDGALDGDGAGDGAGDDGAGDGADTES